MSQKIDKIKAKIQLPHLPFRHKEPKEALPLIEQVLNQFHLEKLQRRIELDKENLQHPPSSIEALEKQAQKKTSTLINKFNRLLKINKWIAVPSNTHQYFSNAVELMIEIYNASLEHKQHLIEKLSQLSSITLNELITTAELSEIYLGLKQGSLTENILNEFSDFYSSFINELDISDEQKTGLVNGLSQSMITHQLTVLQQEKQKFSLTLKQVELEANCQIHFEGISALARDNNFSDTPAGRNNRTRFLKYYAAIQPNISKININYDMVFFIRGLTNERQFQKACQQLLKVKPQLESLLQCEQTTNDFMSRMIESRITQIREHQAEIKQKFDQVLNKNLFKKFIGSTVENIISGMINEFPMGLLLSDSLCDHLRKNLLQVAEADQKKLEQPHYRLTDKSFSSLKEKILSKSRNILLSEDFVSLKDKVLRVNRYYHALKYLSERESTLPLALQNNITSFLSKVEKNIASTDILHDELIIMLEQIKECAKRNMVAKEGFALLSSSSVDLYRAASGSQTAHKVSTSFKSSSATSFFAPPLATIEEVPSISINSTPIKG